MDADCVAATLRARILPVVRRTDLGREAVEPSQALNAPALLATGVAAVVHRAHAVEGCAELVLTANSAALVNNALKLPPRPF